ncbi:MAG: serine hydrolase [Bacteroidota bacterium]
MKFTNFFVVLLLLILPIISFSQNYKADIDKVINTYFEQGKFHGSALVADNGSVIYKKGFGHANIEWDIPNKPDTRFRIGSITKQFTAVLVLQMMEEGQIELDATISEYLPWYRKDIGEKVTIHQLLNHTSGIPSYTNRDFFEEASRDYYAPKDFVEKYCSKDFEFQPGEQFRYNNSGYFILGAIIEEISGHSYEKMLHKKIFKPLGMANTGYDNHGTIITNRASGYEKDGTGLINAPYLDMALPYAAGSMYSTVEDLYTWDQALYDTKILSQKSKDLMFSKTVDAFGAHYGYGWVIREINLPGDKSFKIIEHGGGINGFNTIIFRIVNTKDLIVLFNNTGGAPLAPMAQEIGKIINDMPYELPKQSISDMLVEKIGEGSYADIQKTYDAIKEKHGDDLYYGEGELNTLGYQLMGAERIEDAIHVFKYNIELHPDAFNPYDSLAEAYMNMGEKDKAVKYYAKSLALNPKNENAIRMMHKMLDDNKP